MNEIPKDAVYVDVEYYADGFYSGTIWLPAWVKELPADKTVLPDYGYSERREMVYDLIIKRHPQAKKLRIITAKYKKGGV